MQCARHQFLGTRLTSFTPPPPVHSTLSHTSILEKLVGLLRSSSSGVKMTDRNSNPSVPAPRPGGPLAEPATLMLKIIEGKGLSPKDINGLSDPYCVITVTGAKAGNKVRTKTVPKSLSPVWGEKYEFQITSSGAQVEIEVWDEDFLTPDDFMGYVTIPLDGVTPGTPVEKWLPVKPRKSKDKVSGEIHVYFLYTQSKKGMSVDDFEMLALLGKGTFGKVFQVRRKSNNKIYAMKVLKKSHIVKQQEIEHTLAERSILKSVKHPFMINLRFSFQSDTKLYLVLDYANGGELFYHLMKERRFSEERARFYAAEIVLAIEYLHSRGIIYRDLKPENILLEDSGHVRVTDFGLSKEGMFDTNDRTTTFCGTPAYLPPEVIRKQPYGKEMDWWCLGNLIFEMMTGLPPFYVQNSSNINDVYDRILRGDLRFPPYVSPVAQSIMKGLLELEPAKRLGHQDNAKPIKEHPFFAGIDWDKLLKKQIAPPFIPPVRSATDIGNFDPTFTKERPADTEYAAPIAAHDDAKFKGFDYSDDSEEKRISREAPQPAKH